MVTIKNQWTPPTASHAVTVHPIDKPPLEAQHAASNSTQGANKERRQTNKPRRLSIALSREQLAATKHNTHNQDHDNETRESRSLQNHDRGRNIRRMASYLL
jgi:hypothetical protein